MSSEPLIEGGGAARGAGDEGRPPPGFVVGDDGPFVPTKILEEERGCMDDLQAQRCPDGQRTAPFSIAFSGGGIRAAAFQAGVLWRLAQMNRLKDVEYFAAVSGGGYITSAFASHCAAAEPPKTGGVRQWYLDVVAKTLCRMQENAGDFVRDCVKNPGGPVDGAGCLPRSFDLPLLLGTLAVAILWNPFILVISIMTPMTEYINFFFGGAMRAAFCAPPSTSWLSLFLRWSSVPKMMKVAVLVIFACFVVFVLRKILPGCSLRQRSNGKWRASRTFLVGYNAAAFLTRFAMGLLFIVLFLILVPALQVALYELTDARAELRQAYCYDYIHSGHDVTCSDLHEGSPWYKDDMFTQVASPLGGRPGEAELEVQFGARYRLTTLFGGVLLAAILFAVVCMPIIGAELLTTILSIAGPLFLAVLLLCFVQFRVYGPITPEKLAGGISFDLGTWQTFVTWSLRLSLILLPFYEEIRAILHFYYAKSLQSNFFREGKDVAFTKLAECPYCPFILLTGTSSDFQPPNDVDNISELSFSALHTGSLETGYVKQLPFRSLAKCTALTGAGCLDAITLSMTNAMSLRFWLQVLNLSWGDYIIFEGTQVWLTQKIVDFVGEVAGGAAATAVNRLMHRLPAIIFWWFCLGLLNVAWHLSHFSSAMACDAGRGIFAFTGYLMLLALALSFFAFLPGLGFLEFSPVIRQIHQGTKHCYIGDVDEGIAPPRMLYVTDGGVKDCTTLVQLMQRRCERILLVLAASDPRDDLGVLKAAMAVASTHHLGSFFDPQDPRKDINILFEKYKNDKAMPYLHVGILYGWSQDGDGARGDLFIVKNRLPPDHMNERIQPPLCEEEISQCCAPAWHEEDENAWKDLTTDKLGPFGCCDCCHTNNLNCGPKFPHGTFTGYLYITPQWCNSLSRLAYDTSQQAIDAMTAMS